MLASPAAEVRKNKSSVLIAPSNTYKFTLIYIHGWLIVLSKNGYLCMLSEAAGFGADGPQRILQTSLVQKGVLF